MEGDTVETRLKDLQKLQLELILDCCSSKLWKEFKNGSKLSKELLVSLRDMFLKNKNFSCDNNILQIKLYCTRFFCGLSECRQLTDDGHEVFLPINPMCIAHAQEICDQFALNNQQHFISNLKVQVILSAYRAGKKEKALKLFTDLFATNGQKYQEDLSYKEELSQLFKSSENENQTLKRFSYNEFLSLVVEFLKPIFCKYEVPFLEKNEKAYVDSLDSVNKRIPASFLKINVADDDPEAIWDSIIRGTHHDIVEFKKKNINLETKQKNKHSDTDGSLLEDDNGTEKKNNMFKLKESTVEKSKPKKLDRSPFKKQRWNQYQKNAAVIEWSDSDEELLNCSNNNSPKRCLNVLIPKPPKRRRKNPWTEEEFLWLLKGVKKYGQGQWSVILRKYSFSPGRTSVDLKDKWRNYCRKNF